MRFEALYGSVEEENEARDVVKEARSGYERRMKREYEQYAREYYAAAANANANANANINVTAGATTEAMDVDRPQPTSSTATAMNSAPVAGEKRKAPSDVDGDGEGTERGSVVGEASKKAKMGTSVFFTIRLYNL